MFSGGGQFLAGLFFWLFMLLVTLLLPLDLYESHPVVTALLLLLLAVGGSFYPALPLFQALPVLLRVSLFLLLQGGALILWGRAGGVNPGELLFSGQSLAQASRWWIPAVITWEGGKRLGRLFYGLQRRPSRPVHIWSKQWEEKVVDMTFWINHWRDFQSAVGGLLGIGVMGFALSSHLTGGMPPATGRILLWLFTLCGLLLLTEGNYCYQQAFWTMEGLKADSPLRKEWRSWTGVFLLSLSILNLLLPGDFQAVGFKGLRWLYQRLVSLWPEPVAPEVETEIPSASPWKIAAFSDGQPGLFTQILSILYLFFMGLLMALIIGVLLGLIGFFLYRSVAGEVHKLRGLPKTLTRFYLFLRRLWQKRLRKTGLLGEGQSRLESDPVSRGRKRKEILTWGRGSRALIRRGYYRLLSKARQQGLLWQASQTPEEIGTALTAMLPEAEEAVKHVTAVYQEARYGPVDPSREKLFSFERRRRVLEKGLSGSRKELGVRGD